LWSYHTSYHLAMASSEAFVTLATNDSYSLGALVLGHSLREAGTTRQLAILVTPGVSNPMKETLKTVFDLVHEVDVINSNDERILAAMKRPELGVTLTKIHCWTLTQYTKCVMMDADILVLKNIDDLFEREELSAVPDIGWPDIFNSGVFVFKPSQATFAALVELAAREGSFDGGDQGLLNSYFSDWRTSDISRHLSFIYNMCLSAVYSYPPAYKRFGQNVRVIHFLGSLKPWMYGYDVQTNTVSAPSGHQSLQQLDHVQKWWQIFTTKVQPQLSAECAGIAGSLARLSISSSSSGASASGGAAAPDPLVQKAEWEHGQIDYMGRDSFDNIQKKLDESINGKH